MDLVLKTVIPSLLEEGLFGDVKYLNLKPDDSVAMGSQFGSTLNFYKLEVQLGSSTKLIPLVVKLPLSDPTTREARNCDVMFHNEVTMYKEILPALNAVSQSFPKLYYGSSTSGVNADNDCLILENLTSRRFELSRHKIFLDYDHISLAIIRIAEFHSLSYILKQKNREVFDTMRNKLKDVTFPKPQQSRLQAIQYATIKRGINPLLENNNDILKQCLHFLKDPQKMKRFLSTPEEPFAVICHGDFCNNNLLYKYDDFGRPIDCTFLDFQLSQYASPAIDLFFFLYMHTTSDFREKFWDEMLKVYWNTLKSRLPNDIVIPSFEDYSQHFGCRAVYGYIICSWFLPLMLDHNPITKEDYSALSLEEKAARFSNLGGNKGEQIITDIVRHLLDKKYLEEFIKFCQRK